MVGIGLDKMTPNRGAGESAEGGELGTLKGVVGFFFGIKVSNMFRPSFESEAVSSEAFAFEKNGEPVAKAGDRL